MLGLAMASWTNEQLRGVVDAPIEAWGHGNKRDDDGFTLIHGGYCPPLGKFCLLEHAGIDWQMKIPESLQAMRFDRLCWRLGLPLTVRLLKDRALKILLARQPLVPVIGEWVEVEG